MQFITWQFIVFFIVAMIFLLPRFKNKKYVLAALNVVFYISSGISGLIILLLFTSLTYLFGLFAEKNKSKVLFSVFLILSLAPLLFYKYTNFLLCDMLNMEHKNIIAPLGISFFTFQGVGYIIDVYRGKYLAEKNPVNYFIFISLFTCVTSGPINRGESILSQIRAYGENEFNYKRCVDGLKYVLIGIFLKVLISSRVEQMVSVPFAEPSASSGLALLIASVCFTIQIFCDFCGYSYMSYGLSKVIGIDVIQNFNSPYFSKSVTEFWRRWHISLSSWLRDYVYFPLGGSRCSKYRNYANILITFTLSGLWHGASWTFIIWGLLNGVCLAAEKMTGFNKKITGRISAFIHWFITISVTNIMWVFFRANTLKDALIIVRKIFIESVSDIHLVSSMEGIEKLLSQTGSTLSGAIATIIALFLFFAFEVFFDRKGKVTAFLDSRNIIVRWVLYICIISLILVFGVTGKAGEFIYAKF